MSWGAGEHFPVVMAENPGVLIPLQQITFAQYFIWGITILLIKLSILLLYRGIFHCMVYTLVAIYVSIAVCVGIWILQIGILFGSCRPLAFNWDPSVPGSCYFKGVSEYVISMSTNLAMDIVLVLIPAPEVWRLKHISIRKKIGISCVFGLGILTCILVGLRFKYLHEMNMADATHDGVPSGIIASVELYLGIICACLPILPPAFVQAGKKVQNSYAAGLLTRKTSKESSLRSGKGNHAAEDVKEPNYDQVELNPWPPETQPEVRA
ncbi:hypothetical protein P171DRAFT_265728 [Karstenula rhodostoma CBS 690.94]|uniref:Rhodopsin domain-containing protein n=1 Tax=Karstenula rhodostoma CBS 690.94 TaxID=1392251 RepID=A0A9P4PK10_9PLEO|nr:hypothetical protein P171DRAFT_265728 [Karstenula rhodostoma CBS 690.94]